MVHIPDLIPDGLIAADGYKFSLMYRQEQSRMSSGITLVKDFGTPLFVMEATTHALLNDDVLELEAKIERLDNGLGTFTAWDVRKPFPKLHPKGDFADTAKIATVGSDKKSLSLYDLPPNFKLSVGDYLSFQSTGWASLHRVVSPVTADENGATLQFEVRPHLWFSAVADTPVRLRKPSTVMGLLPNSVIVTPVNSLCSSVSFKAIQVPGVLP